MRSLNPMLTHEAHSVVGPCNCTCHSTSSLRRSMRRSTSATECDGKIPASELYVAILLLYHRINAMSLGGGLKKPPNR